MMDYFLIIVFVRSLADLASFHDYATKTYKLTASNTWISFGGSYPGALSAWFRLKVRVYDSVKKRFLSF